MENSSRRDAPLGDRVGIVVGGGPAPGINGAIGAVTLEAGNRGHQVVGIYDGFSHLMEGKIDHTKLLDHDDVSRIHFDGGSILNTSRANPTTKTEDMGRVVPTLETAPLRDLVSIS